MHEYFICCENYIREEYNKYLQFVLTHFDFNCNRQAVNATEEVHYSAEKVGQVYKLDRVRIDKQPSNSILESIA